MKTNHKHLVAATAAVLTAGLAIGSASAVLASSDDDNHAAAALTAEIPATQAVEIAETETGGRVLELELELEDGTVAYEVEVALEDGSIVELMIDANTGAVSAEAEDDEDGDDD